MDATCPGGCPAGEMPAREPNFLRNLSPKTWLARADRGSPGSLRPRGRPANPGQPPPRSTFPYIVPNSRPSSAWLPDAAHPQASPGASAGVNDSRLDGRKIS